jgi:regulator of protease activity HflC (stomatin/prohibitin superfamily)
VKNNLEIKSIATNKHESAYTIFKRWLRYQKNLLIILILIALSALIFFWSYIVITIKPGEAGVLFERFSGTKIDRVYDEGVHLFSPLDTLYIYEIRKQIAFHEFEVISVKGLTVHIALAIRYRPEYELLAILHQSIGPDYLNRVIIPQIESVMRKQLGNYTAEEIYTNEKGLLTQTILTAMEEVGRNYIEVEDIIIRSIVLPQEIVVSIENKLKEEELMKAYEFKIITAQKEAERLEIEANGVNTYQKIIDTSLSDAILLYKGIEATKILSMSDNTKVIVIGSGKHGLPLILGGNQAEKIATPSLSKSKNNKKKLAAPNKLNSAEIDTSHSNIQK